MIHPMSLVMISTFAIAIGASTGFAQVQEAAQLACNEVLLDASERVIDAQNRVEHLCFRRAGRGSVPDVSSCFADDRYTRRLDTIIERAQHASAEACKAASPDLGPSDPNAVIDSSKLGSVTLLTDIFGEPLDSNVLSCADDRFACRCQQMVLRRASERYAYHLGRILECQRAALAGGASSASDLGACLSAPGDPNAPTTEDPFDQRSYVRVANTIDRQCDAQQVSTSSFAGKCTGLTGAALIACVESAVRCRACTTISSMGGTTSSCDLFDDGQANGSCFECSGVDQACCPGDLCAGSLTCCDGTCRDTQNDPEHCGSCDIGCDDGLFCTGVEECSAGNCSSPGDPCPGTDCLATCNEGPDDCYDPVGTTCGIPGEYCHPLGACGSPVCGDGVAISAAGEECDRAGESRACDADCTFTVCGDLTINTTAGETCDEGGETSDCDSDCTGATCGDGTLNTTAGEICDDGGDSATCNANCTVAACGDGILNLAADENCDPGSESEFCNADCSFSVCGDSIVNQSSGEECDDGEATSNCDNDCTFASCGDGTLNPQAGEECDNGGAGAGCDANCMTVSCGNGQLQSGEECDDGGESATCDSDCTAASCGDGTVNQTAGEDCDDGLATSYCNATCGLVADEKISVTQVGDTVVIIGTSRGDDVTVSVGGTVLVSYTELGSEITRNFSTSTVAEIKFEGRAGNDGLDGTNCNLPIYADGGDGDDEIFGGSAADVLEGGFGQDNLYGNDGGDTLCGYQLYDNPVGSAPYLICDVLTQDRPTKALGGDGRDLIGGSNHLDLAGNIISGGPDKDEICGGWNSFSIIYGGNGDDTIWGLFAQDNIYAGAGDDYVTGGEGNDYIWGDSCSGVPEIYCGDGGSSGKDKIFAGPGDDNVYGGNGKDEIHGEEGDDLIYGGGGDDALHGGQGDDEIHGQDGIDEVRGGQGDDKIYGGLLGDKLVGAPSGHGSSDKDLCVGGHGSDTFKRCDCDAFQEFFGSETCN